MVSIVIPTLFPNPKLEHYATSLSRYPAVREVTIVVNTSGADRDENTVHWRYLGKNKGFTGACNAGAKIAKGEFLLFLNDDCDMSEDALKKMVGFLEQNADVVATQPIITKSLVPSAQNLGHTTIENIGFWVDTKIGKAYPVTETLNSKFETLREKDKSIYGFSGTCLLIRKDIFEKVGMWDESFHSYLEDVDLAIRLKKTRYKSAPCLDAEVIHEHMATSSKMGLYKEKQDVINWWKLVLKHSDVFIRLTTIFPLLLERGRNISGLIKKILRRVIQ